MKNILDMFSSPEKKHAELMETLKQGHVTCEKCGKTVEFGSCVPLTLDKCPSCEDVLFIPMNVGEWWVLRPAAAGGFGSVYVGVSETDPNRKVAIKILRHTDSTKQEDADKFIREGEILEQLGAHPNIPKLYEYGYLEDDEHAVIIMEYIEGIDLDHYVRHIMTKLPPEEALYYTLDLCDTLEHINNQGFLYRDLKPANIVINKENSAILIDFGLCIDAEEAQQKEMPVFGSPRSVPPERIWKTGEDIRSDIYSLGMTVYFMVMGEWYFSATDVQSMIKSHTMFSRLAPKSKMFGAPEPIVELVTHMIQRDLEKRPSSYEELRNSIVAIIRQLMAGPPANPVVKKRRKAFIARFGEEQPEEKSKKK
jgi:eukaryotic-like serine/threonine-protein kinase